MKHAPNIRPANPDAMADAALMLILRMDADAADALADRLRSHAARGNPRAARFAPLRATAAEDALTIHHFGDPR